MFRKQCLDQCDRGRAFVHKGRRVHRGQATAELKFEMLEFGRFLTDSSELWKVFDLVMGNFEKQDLASSSDVLGSSRLGGKETGYVS